MIVYTFNPSTHILTLVIMLLNYTIKYYAYNFERYVFLRDFF